MSKPRLEFRRVDNDTATAIGYTAGFAYTSIRVLDWSDAETIAGQLRVLADRIAPHQVAPKGYELSKRRM